jgi:hypothetical protein
MSLYKHIKVEDALKEHAELMVKVREQCKSEIEKDPQQFNDDLFLVRFCLSHKGDAEKAVHAVKTTIAWRLKHKDLLAKLATGWRHPHEELLLRYTPVQVHGQLKDRSPFLVVRAGVGNPDRLMEELSPEIIRNGLIFSKEAIYQLCTAETRAKGYIVKMVSAQDMKHGSMFDFNRGFMSLLGETSKEMELCYPQLVGKVVMINTPRFLSMIMTVAQALLPASMFEKITVCGGRSTVTGNITDCPIATSIFDLETLPSFLGGKCKCADKGGCIGGAANDLKEKVQPPPLTKEEKEMVQATKKEE